jgi:peptidoglycan hydrolase-like protein with peptidoglycan-binding domain
VANDVVGGNWHVSDKALAALIDLCVDICKRNDIKKLNYTGDKSGNLTMHKWFASTLCPGPYLESKFPYIANEVNKRLTGDDKKPVVESYTLKQFVMDVQRVTGAMVDGIPGPETLSKTPTLSAHINAMHPAVKFVQKRLAVLGYAEVGAADGIAGPKFTSAVAHFQFDNGCVQDGEITARNTTWKKLLGMA